MAVLALKSIQKTDGVLKYPIDQHGKLRYDYFELAPVTVAGDAGSTVELCDLPPGRVRILVHACRIATSAFGAGRTLNIGHHSYSVRDSYSSQVTDEPENPTAFVNALDVSGAVANSSFSTVMKYDVYSKAGVQLFATVNGGTIPVGATLRGLIAYIYE